MVCPNCGQHVDKTNIRCPRCRQWFVTPPGPRTWSRLAVVLAMVSLALGGFVAGMALQWVWHPLPPGVVVPDDVSAPGVPAPADQR
jgi:hypothetical protein